MLHLPELTFWVNGRQAIKPITRFFAQLVQTH